MMRNYFLFGMAISFVWVHQAFALVPSPTDSNLVNASLAPANASASRFFPLSQSAFRRAPTVSPLPSASRSSAKLPPRPSVQNSASAYAGKESAMTEDQARLLLSIFNASY